MKRPKKINVKPKILIFVLTLLCIIALILSATFTGFSKPLKNAASIVIVPLQEGVNNIGMWFSNKTDLFEDIKKLKKENEELKKKNEALSEENSLLAQNKYELERLQDLYNLDQDYNSYKKVGARVIGRDTNNWFDTFTINKGSDDGIKKDMNVITTGGLVGIVYDVGKNYAKVRSIIDDESSVSVSFVNTSDTGIVSGDLKLMDEGYLNITQILKDANVTEGDMIVTSQISDKFLPGIKVGYISEVSNNSDDLTKSGKIIPSVDFKHINEVLVILQLKETLED